MPVGPSAGNSFDPQEGRFSKDYGADQQRLQISDLHFDKFPTPTTFACWKIRIKTEVCTCLQFPTEVMLWIKQVEMVESVDDLKSSRSIKRNPGPDFELLDARIASALNKIIQNTRFKKKVSLEEMKAHKEDRFLRGRQIAYLMARRMGPQGRCQEQAAADSRGSRTCVYANTSLSCFSPSSTSPLPYSTCSLSGTPSPMSIQPRVKTTALSQNEEYRHVAIYNPLTLCT